MVAYSFHAMFADQVAALTKLHTVRADRRRHARPGEPIQLYTGMRTRACRKLVDPDPICVSAEPIRILLAPAFGIGAIILAGVSLDADAIEAFARSDGFDVAIVGDWRMREEGVPGSARWNMGHFWKRAHGAPSVFQGVKIAWRPSHG